MIVVRVSSRDAEEESIAGGRQGVLGPCPVLEALAKVRNVR